MEFGFILKKTISIFIMPMSIALFILFIGLIILYRNKVKSSKFILTIGFLILCLFSYSPFSNTLINGLEKQYPKLQTVPDNVEYILLLGGDFEQRAWEVLRLYNQNQDLKIITSGYQSSYNEPEAIRSANKLVELGIPKRNIIIHPNPKDTKEEAVKIKEFLGDEAFILVTAAHHMPRAMALFKKQGTNPIASSSNEPNRKIDFLTIPNVSALFTTTIVLHEYIGILWAKLRGQI